jgi:hypothetical protein
VSKWIIAGTDADQPYPCRCHEARYGQCNAAWCPCAGRPDPPKTSCCGTWFAPVDVVKAKEAWRIAQLTKNVVR